MSISQVSVFIQNKPGHMKRILDTFESANISVRGFSASDTGDYGVVRFIVDDTDAAVEVLREAGAAAAKSEVLCIRLVDKPGEFARVMGILADCGINVRYCYSLISTYIVASVDDIAEAEKALSGEPVELAELADLAAPISH